ncbi:MAG: tRNA epoxyqueuosine(34) reductase QueG [Anaerolineales bacterium]|jgi:epoxyqueuosine reductase
MSVQSLPIEEQIKSAARHLGFSLIGITTPDRPQNFNSYQKWIAEGKHGSMRYLATERNLRRRENPRKIHPECKSIIVTGTPYLPENHFAATDDSEVRIASYALGDDYHDIIPARLTELVAFIETVVGRSLSHKIYSDTGPILERDLAQRAGLGWIGKNTCLISPDQGSYFLLGEILLDLPLQSDTPFNADRCGTCTRCLEACPTQCILPNRTIDARRCISYLTIEEKKSMDKLLRGRVGKWIFGCDICQQVCPWNQHFARPIADPRFQPRKALETPQIDMFLNLKAGDWLQDLRGSPLERPRRKGLVRNALVAVGNQPSKEHIEALSKLLRSDPEPMVRSHSAWALGQIEGPQSLAVLENALNFEDNPEVIAEIRAAVENFS